jgi:hypothetical protein
MLRVGQLFPSLLILFIALSSNLACGAEVTPEVRRVASLTTATEAALATTSLIKDRGLGKPLQAEWSITFSDRNWVLNIKSPEFGYTMAGFLWGGDTEDWVIYSGLGSTGKEPIFISGKAVWKYDGKDWTSMNFDNVVKFGENSFWGWTKGAEVLVGGTIGAAGGIIVGGTLGPTGAVIVGLAGAIGGGSGAVTISEVVRDLVESPDPVIPAPTPKPPPVPQKEQSLPATKNMIVVAVLKDGRIQGTGPDETLFLSGSHKERSGTGSIGER